jgi:hypothetical protein
MTELEMTYVGMTKIWGIRRGDRNIEIASYITDRSARVPCATALPVIAVSGKPLPMTLKQYATDTEAGLSVIKSAMLLNGGAAISMLAFIAYLSESRPFSIPVLAPTIMPFAFGTFLSGLIYGGQYLAQHYYARGQMSWGNRITLFCIALGLACYLAFLIGILLVYSVLSSKL